MALSVVFFFPSRSSQLADYIISSSWAVVSWIASVCQYMLICQCFFLELLYDKAHTLTPGFEGQRLWGIDCVKWLQRTHCVICVVLCLRKVYLFPVCVWVGVWHSCPPTCVTCNEEAGLFSAPLVISSKPWQTKSWQVVAKHVKFNDEYFSFPSFLLCPSSLWIVCVFESVHCVYVHMCDVWGTCVGLIPVN